MHTLNFDENIKEIPRFVLNIDVLLHQEFYTIGLQFKWIQRPVSGSTMTSSSYDSALFATSRECGNILGLKKYRKSYNDMRQVYIGDSPAESWSVAIDPPTLL